ncbi:MAG TPA: type IV pilin N-terminal domain-containing protein [candidate division Zixibacteria bacterium]|nr:type IV pilin N-terminal domain-containing protein [candidate division Zixibacteria bacterium]
MRHSKSGKDKGIFEDDRGVSPVIAVILMVAITVVMAAIVSSWSSGVKAPTTPTTVGMDISRDNTNITAVVTAIDPSSSAPVTNITYKYQYYNGTGFTTITGYRAPADVGDSNTYDTNSTSLKQFVVTATFKDGSKKVLYSRET